MSNARLATLTWLLIFGGMLSMALGLTMRRSADTLGLGIALASGVLIAVGVVLVWVRSRRPDGSGHGGDDQVAGSKGGGDGGASDGD